MRGSLVAVFDAHQIFFATSAHGNEQMTVELCLHFGSARKWTMDLLGDLLLAKNHVGSISRVLARASTDDSVAMRMTAVQEYVEIGFVEIPTTADWIKV